VTVEIPGDEIVPEPEDVRAELERLEATRRWEPSRSSGAESALPPVEWKVPAPHPMGSPSIIER
jgi:hypothetical protein